MKLEIRPEPTPAERKAIERALARQPEPRRTRAATSRWRATGVFESTQQTR